MDMKMKKTRGGAMPGAGAKKKADPKVQINLYVLQSTMATIGGSKSEEVNREATRQYLYDKLKVFEK